METNTKFVDFYIFLLKKLLAIWNPPKDQLILNFTLWRNFMSKEKVAQYLETYIHGCPLCAFCQHVVDFHTVHTGCGVMTKIH
jgi:hypothetical protein